MNGPDIPQWPPDPEKPLMETRLIIAEQSVDIRSSNVDFAQVMRKLAELYLSDGSEWEFQVRRIPPRSERLS